MDSKDDISKALNQASKSSERSLRSRLDEYYKQIEEAISSGVTHQTIIEILNEKGIEIGINSFRSALKALRKKHNDQVVKAVSISPAVKPLEPKQATKSESTLKDSIQEIKNTEDEIDLDDLAKIGRQRMKNKLKEKKK